MRWDFHGECGIYQGKLGFHEDRQTKIWNNTGIQWLFRGQARGYNRFWGTIGGQYLHAYRMVYNEDVMGTA